MTNSEQPPRRPSRRSRSVRRVTGGASKLLSQTRLRNGPDGPGDSVQDHLLLRMQKATFREIHQLYTERAERGDAGVPSALDALDTMWLNVRKLRSGAPAIMKTLSSPHGDVQVHLAEFYADSTSLLEDAIRVVFAEDLGNLALPPDRMAVLVRVMLEGLVVELAQARDADDVALVDQAYADLRVLFERFVLSGSDGGALEPLSMDPIPLPW